MNFIITKKSNIYDINDVSYCSDNLIQVTDFGSVLLEGQSNIMYACMYVCMMCAGMYV